MSLMGHGNDNMSKFTESELRIALQNIYNIADKCLNKDELFTKRDLKYVAQIHSIAKKYEFTGKCRLKNKNI